MKVRFPPSPTGRKHIGNYRTFLFAWLYARQHGGSVVLRFEDTDPERSRREYEQGIIDMLHWLGLDWDEGPFRQSERLDRYREAAARLLESGRAYRCWCTPEQIEEMRSRSKGAGRPPDWEHDRWCPEQPPREGPAAVRFRVPRQGVTSFVDLVRGEVSVENETINDRVILRSDGSPLYVLCVVVDDFEMGVTHVLRGEDLLPNTPLQILLAAALGRPEPPTFGHLPLIVGPDRAKLSTRHGPVALEDYRDDGILAEAAVNYLGLLGWSFPDGREIFTLDEMRQAFDIERVGKTSALFDAVKLDSVNFEWIQRLGIDEVTRRSLRFFGSAGVAGVTEEGLRRAMPLAVERIKRLSEVPAMLGFLFEFPGYDEAAWQKEMTTEWAPVMLAAAIGIVASVEAFTAAELGEAFAAAADEAGIKRNKAFGAPRVALTGSRVGPPLWESMELLGREECRRRLEAARQRLGDC